MKDSERYFAHLNQRLRIELGKKKAKEIVDELDSHYRTKLADLREQGAKDAEAAALEALGPIDAIVEDYSQPAGWMNLKPLERQAIWIPTIGLLAMVLALAAIDLLWDHGLMYEYRKALFPVLTVLCLPLFRAGFLRRRLISRESMLCALMALLIPVTVLSALCYVKIDGEMFSLIKIRQLHRDETAYLKRLEDIQRKIERGKAAFANASDNYAESSFNLLSDELNVKTASVGRTWDRPDLWTVSQELAEAEKSMERYRKGPSIEPYITADGYKVVIGLSTEPCRIYDGGANSYSHYGAFSSRVSGLIYRSDPELSVATQIWQQDIPFSAVKSELDRHQEALAQLEPLVNQPLKDRWPDAAFVFGDVICANYMWLLLVNLFGAATGILWRASSNQYDKLIRS